MRTRRVELQEKLVLYFQTYMQRTGAEDLFGLFDGVSCDVVDSESRDLERFSFKVGCIREICCLAYVSVYLKVMK